MQIRAGSGDPLYRGPPAAKPVLTRPEGPSSGRFGLGPNWLPLAVLALAFAIYSVTAAPGLGPGHDSAELTTASYCLGVAHPPGYPLYVRLAHAWGCCLGACVGGDYGWRINLFSGLGTACAAAGVTWLVRRATGSAPAAVLAGLGFALLGSVWRQSVLAEVFGLHFGLLALLAVLGWQVVEGLDSQRFVPWLWGFYAVVGLCVAHHHTFVLALPGLLLLAWPHWRKVLLTPAWVMVPLVAFPFYADMLLRARGNPALNWGDVSDWEALTNHFLRRSYGTFQLTHEVDSLEQGVVHGLGYLLFTYVRQAPWPWMLLASWGGLVGRRLSRPLWLLGWSWLLAFGPFFALIGRQKLDAFHLDILERFYASSYLGLALLAGLGAAHLLRWLRPFWSWSLVLGLLCWQARHNLESCRLDQRELALSYGRQVLASCPADALLVVYGDLNVGVFQYLQIVERQRLDVQAICPGLLGSPWYYRQLSARVARCVGQRSDDLLTLVTQAEASGMPVIFTQHRGLKGVWWPRSMCWQWSARATPPDQEIYTICLERLLDDAGRLRPGLAGEARFWPLYLISCRISGLRQLASVVFKRQPQLALAALDLAIDLGADRPLDFLNRGLLRQKLGRHKAAIGDFERCLERRPAMELASVALIYSQVFLMVQGPASDMADLCSKH